MKLTLGTHEFNLPTKWQEVTLGQMIALGKHEKQINADPALLLACLITPTNEPGTINEPESPYGLLWRVDIAQSNKILPLTEFINTAFDFTTQSLPQEVTISGKRVTVPKDLSLLSLGQKIISENAMKKQGVDGMPTVIATYLHPLVTGTDFNSDKAKELLPDVWKMKAVEAVPLANFFLHSSQASTRKLNVDATSNSVKTKKPRTRNR